MAGKNFGRVNVSITASTGGLTAGLGRASKQLGGFSSSVGGMTGGLNQMNAAIGDSGVLFSDISGLLGSIAVSFKSGALATHLFRGSIQLLMVAIRALLIPLAIVASVAGFFSAFRKAAEDIDAASKSAKRLGIEANSFESFSQVAEEAGVSVGQMTGMLTTLSRNVGNLGNGSKTAQKAFASLGLAFADLQGQSPERQFELISERIMSLPNQQARAAAAAAIFGKSGATALNFIEDAAGGAVTGVKELRTQLGYDLTSEQRAGVQLMNDSVGRMSMVFGGFIRQFVAELAPAIATVANLFVKFFAENTSGFSIAAGMAQILGAAIKGVAGAVTFLYGTFQVLSAFLGVFITGALGAFSAVTEAIGNMLSAMADAAEALPGMDVGLAASLRSASDSVSGLSTAAGDEAELWGQAAADNFANGIQNMSDPFAAFDAEFANVTAQMQQAGAAAGKAAGEGVGSTVSAAIRASGQALEAFVLGTSGGEAFRNAIERGADPRLEGDAAKETANNTERTADGIEDLADELAAGGGFGLASISV
jgi:hypothetical protein